MIKDRAHGQPMGNVLFIAMLLFLAGCSDAGKPTNALCAYWNAVFDGDFNAVYQSHCLIDQAVKSFDEFNREMELTMPEASLLRVCRSDLDLRINRSRVLKDTAEFDITITIPLGLKDKFQYLLTAIQGDSIIGREGQPSLLSRTGLCRLVKEHGQWLVFGGWETRRRKEAEQAQVRLDYLPSLKIQNIVIRNYHNTSRNYLMFNVQNTGQRTVTWIRILLTFPYQVLEETVAFEPSALKPKDLRSVKLDITSTPINWSLQVTIKIMDCGFLE